MLVRAIYKGINFISRCRPAAPMWK